MDRDSDDPDVTEQFDRYVDVLGWMALEGDTEAAMMCGRVISSPLSLQGFIKAVMESDDTKLKLIAKAYTVDIVALGERVRVRAVIERLK